MGVGTRESRESRVESREPDGLLNTTSSPQSLAPLPVEALRVSGETAALLRQLGIETVDQLRALPREDLASRFGEELLRRLDQLTGCGRELIEPQCALPALVASYSLEEPTGDRGVLVHVLKQLTDQLARQLAARDQGAVVVVCLLHLAGGTSGVCDGHGGGAPRTPFAEPQGVPPQVLRIGLLQPSARRGNFWS